MKPKRHRWQRIHSATVGLLLLGMATVGIRFLLLSLGHTYILTDGTRSKSIRLYPGTVQKACDQTGFNAQTILQQSEQGHTTYLQFGQPLYADIHRGTETISVPFQPCTVRQLLQANGIPWSETDTITPALDAQLTADTDIQIVAVSYETVVEYEDIAFGVQSQPSTDLIEGKKRVVREGVNGVKEVTYQVERHDGTEVTRTVQSERLLVEPLDCIIEKGVSKPKTPTVKQKQAPPEPLPTVGEMEKRQAAATPSSPSVPAVSSPSSASLSETKPADAAPDTFTAPVAPTEPATPDELDKPEPTPSEIWQSPVFIVDYVQNKTLIRKNGENLLYSDVREGQAIACCIGPIDQPTAQSIAETVSPDSITTSTDDDEATSPDNTTASTDDNEAVSPDNLTASTNDDETASSDSMTASTDDDEAASDSMTASTDDDETASSEEEINSPTAPTDSFAIPYTTAAYGSILVDPQSFPVGCRVLVVSHDDKRNWAYGPCETVDSKGVVEGNNIGLPFLTEEETELFGTCAAHCYILAD